MIKAPHIFGNRSFATKEELFRAIVDNEAEIIEAKKSHVFKSIEKGQQVTYVDLAESFIEAAEKAAMQIRKGYIYPVINSTLWLDSHGDVHMPGCYKKTVRDQKGKVSFIDSHGKGLPYLIARKSAVNMLVREVDWKTLGKNVSGTTESLVFEIAEKDVRPDYLEYLQNEADTECSFAMRYIKLRTAINSDDPYYAQQKQNYDETIGMIANRDLAESMGYYWIVDELSIVGEGSACPITGGSNSATTVIMPQGNENKDTPEAVTDTSKMSVPQEPSNDDTLAKLKSIIDNI